MSDADVMEGYADAILRACAAGGVGTPEKGYVADGGIGLAEHNLKELVGKLREAERDRDRWLARMQILEKRVGFAAEALSGKRDE